MKRKCTCVAGEVYRARRNYGKSRETSEDSRTLFTINASCHAMPASLLSLLSTVERAVPDSRGGPPVPPDLAFLSASSAWFVLLQQLAAWRCSQVLLVRPGLCCAEEAVQASLDFVQRAA